MKIRYLLPIAAVLLVMVFLFTGDKSKKHKQAEQEEGEEITPQAQVQQLRPSGSSLANTEKSEIISGDVSQTTSATAVAKIPNEKILRQFSIHLKSMAKCLNLSGVQNVNEKTEPSVENLINQLKASLGEIAIQTEDWSQVEFVDQGVKKRVRVDYDYPDGVTATRRLSMYQINSYNMPEIISLSADEANNPNEAYINSLSEGHDIINDEKGTRAYFADGEELITSQRNGQLQSVNISKGDRSFNCINLDEETSSCTCP